VAFVRTELELLGGEDLASIEARGEPVTGDPPAVPAIEDGALRGEGPRPCGRGEEWRPTAYLRYGDHSETFQP